MAQALKVDIIGDTSSYARALRTASGETASFGSSLGKLARIAAGVFAGVEVTRFGKTVVTAAVEAEASATALTKALKNQGLAFDAASPAVQKLEENSRKLGFTNEDTRDSITRLVQSGKTWTQATQELSVAHDLARSRALSLGDATKALILLQAGNTRAAKQFGIILPAVTTNVDKLRAAHVDLTTAAGKLALQHAKVLDVMARGQAGYTQLQQKIEGQGQAFADTAAGGMARFHAALVNLEEQLGAPLASVLGKAASGLATFIEKVSAVHGISAKIKVAAQLVWVGLKQGVEGLRKQFSDLLFGSFQKGGGVGPEGIKFNKGLISQFTTALAALDWTAVGQSVIKAIGDAIQGTGDLAKRLATTVTEAIGQVDWVAVGRILGPGLAAAVVQAFVTLTDPTFWVKNWDLALAVALAALTVVFPEGKLGEILVKPFAGAGERAMLALASSLERLSPRLAEVMLKALLDLGAITSTGFRALGAIAGRALGTLEGVVRAFFGKLGGLAVFTIKVLGIDIAINALVQFAGGPVWNALRTAFASVSAAAQAMVAAVKRVIDALIAILTGAAGTAAAKGTAIGTGIVKGVSSGITGLVSAVQSKFQDLWGWIKGAAGSAYAYAFRIGSRIVEGLISGLGDIASKIGGKIKSGVEKGLSYADPRKIFPFSPVSHWAILLANELVSKMSSLTDILGPALVKAITAAIKGAGSTAEAGAATIGKGLAKGLGNAAPAIIAAAKKAGVDARAALAVAMTEGGTSFGGKPGDSGTSFGPFQLHIGGASPYGDPAKAKAFADSVQGITYALNQMAAAGAKGKTGFDAISAIVRNFERPANPAAEIAKAIGYYKQIPAGLAAAVTQGSGKVTAAHLKQLLEILRLTQKYGKVIGLEHAKQVIAGMFQGQSGIVKQAHDALAAAAAAAKQAWIDSKASFVSAFQSFATDALSAFDQKMAAWVPPATRLLDKMQLADQVKQARDTLAAAIAQVSGGGAAAAADISKTLGDSIGGAMAKAISEISGAKTEAALNKVSAQAQQQVIAAVNAAAAPAEAAAQQAVAAAQGGLTAAQATGDPEKIAAAQQALDTAVANQAALDAAVKAQIEFDIGQLAAAEQAKHDAITAKQREGLAKQLTELQTWLAKHPAEWAKMGEKVKALLAKYGVEVLGPAGTRWGNEFADGLRKSIPAAEAAAKAYAAAVAKYMPHKSPADFGPLAFDMVKAATNWIGDFAEGIARGSATLNATLLQAVRALLGLPPGAQASNFFRQGGNLSDGGTADKTPNVFVPDSVTSFNQAVKDGATVVLQFGEGMQTTLATLPTFAKGVQTGSDGLLVFNKGVQDGGDVLAPFNSWIKAGSDVLPSFVTGIKDGGAALGTFLRGLGGTLSSGGGTFGGGGTASSLGSSSGGDTHVTVNMPNYLGDVRSAAQEIRTELQRIGRDNAINPLAI